ncbi:hypothetical protein CHY08_18245 [Rhizobium leguminosarum bv. viciae]|uniref:hypothetical protein n=1 Tax=Rhizobium leguminosarum TaxID=384 RepID=UPI000B8CC1E2|nr:hypothetical protein [Rhizobium leguminosarum]ASR08878.1 hypothetical protein CHY08_18245 [Rhizobium leguminosarum bv. viciae]
MVDLSDTVPREKFIPLFKNVREELVANDIKTLEIHRPNDVIGVSLYIWDEMVHRGIAKEPFKISPIINNDMVGIYDFVREELGNEPVTDVYSTRFFNEIDAAMSFVDVTLLQCFPDDIHIADVEFADNRRPVDNTPPVKGARNYHGLHIFDDFLERLKGVARDRGVGRLSLMVGGPGLYEVFARHGFKVGESVMAQMAFKNTRMGFSMYQDL